MQVASTTKYAQFKDILGNRIINKEHVARLRKEIQANNLLATCPIIVNEKMEVIDGQHRLEAARGLKVPVFYVKVPGLGIEHIIRLNTSQRRWGIWDYITLHIEHGNEEYVELKKFCDTYGFSPTVGSILTSERSFGTTKSAAFREGRFEIKDLDQGHEIAKAMKMLVGSYRTNVTQRQDAFAAAMKKAAMQLQEQGHSIFDLVSIIKEQGLVVENYSRTRDYYRDFENWLGKAKIKVRLY